MEKGKFQCFWRCSSKTVSLPCKCAICTFASANECKHFTLVEKILQLIQLSGTYGKLVKLLIFFQFLKLGATKMQYVRLTHALKIVSLLFKRSIFLMGV